MAVFCVGDAVGFYGAYKNREFLLKIFAVISIAGAIFVVYNIVFAHSYAYGGTLVLTIFVAVLAYDYFVDVRDKTVASG